MQALGVTHARKPFNIDQALCCVFFTHAATSPAPQAHRRAHPNSQSLRSFSSTHRRIRRGDYIGSLPRGAVVAELQKLNVDKFSAGRDRRPQDGLARNENIDTRRAYLRKSDGKLSDALLFSIILNMRERDENGTFTQFVQELAPANEDRPYPVVDLKGYKEEKEQQQARKQAAKQTKTAEKLVEIGWSIDENDLGHRIRKIQGFLRKGAKVEILIGSRRLRGWSRKKEMSVEDGQTLVDKLKKAATEVEGTKERAAMQGQVLKQIVLTYQGPGVKERETKSEEQTRASQQSPVEYV